MLVVTTQQHSVTFRQFFYAEEIRNWHVKIHVDDHADHQIVLIKISAAMFFRLVNMYGFYGLASDAGTTFT